ncbi:hypothetical protein S40288_00795 [Stachybotrys chartarum IBT 40288]|nr:hypothetical protein S40288_00795 [Stachybotrys chartarum IBT 40288]
MLSVAGIRNACPKCSISFPLGPKLGSVRFVKTFRPRGSLLSQQRAVLLSAPRSLSTSRCLRQEQPKPDVENDAESIEQIVRDAKQRFRDTLPKDYLSEEEYALYERLYGPPLRETRPEDVGIDTHADMGSEAPPPESEGTLLRQLEGGEFEELSYGIKHTPVEEGEEIDVDALGAGEEEQRVATRTPGYAESVARSQREYDAMQKLTLDYEAAIRKQKDEEKLAKEQEEQEVVEVIPQWLPETEYIPAPDEDQEPGEWRRFHPYTLEGQYQGNPAEIVLPQDEFSVPLREMLARSHPRHVKQAAEAAFAGRGLPTSPATPSWRRDGPQVGVGLPPDQRHMTEVEADAFMAAYLPPAYASVMSIMREVRRRMGSEWLQSRLKQGKEAELSVLDAGAGGAGLVAWQQMLQAEWDMLKEKDEVKGDHPPSRRTVVVGSDRLRQRLKTFLGDTTFLPRLPDYEHSTYRSGENLDAGDQPQARKSYDVIIASHLFLKEKQDHYRQAVLNNLWSLLKEDGGVLVVVEKAHPRGFEAVAHVRDTILRRFLLPQSGEPAIAVEETNPAYSRELEKGHIIAPCTNHQVCPMYRTPGKSQGRKDYCHFSQRFVRPAFYKEILGSSDNRGEVEFSYVAFQRGVARQTTVSGKEASELAFKGYERASEQPDMQTLPRVVLPPIKRKGHVTLDACTPEGTIERWTVPKSFSKLAYHDARKSRWGDLWALGAKTRSARNVRLGRGLQEGMKERKGEPMTAEEKRELRAERNGRRARDKRDAVEEALSEIVEGEEQMIDDIAEEELKRDMEKAEREEAEEERPRRGRRERRRR